MPKEEKQFPWDSMEDCISTMAGQVEDAGAFCASRYHDEHGVWPAEEKDKKITAFKEYSQDYLQAIFDVARAELPEWLFAEIHRIAFPKAGVMGKERREQERRRMSEIMERFVPSWGSGKIAFVGASPSAEDLKARRPFSGANREAFIERYLCPLGLTEEDIFITNLVPMVLYDDESGNVRSPTKEEIESWKLLFQREIQKVKPVFLIALGQLAKDVLGERANAVLPHPNALERFGDTGELGRKLKALRESIGKVSPTATQVHVERPLEIIEKQFHSILLKNEERQIVYGVVLEPDTEDAHGDIVTADEIEQTAHRWMRESRVIGQDHVERAGAEVVESFISPQDITLGGQLVKRGSWMLAVKVHDRDLWQGVKSGEYTGFSIGAYARRKEV